MPHDFLKSVTAVLACHFRTHKITTSVHTIDQQAVRTQLKPKKASYHHGGFLTCLRCCKIQAEHCGETGRVIN